MSNFVYIVFYQQEPYPGSDFSGDGYHNRPDNINKICVGVYRTLSAANEAAVNYWVNNLGIDEEDGMQEDYEYDDDNEMYLFLDGRDSGDLSTLSEVVYVEKEVLR